MRGYSALVAGAGYLKGVTLTLSPANGITSGDLAGAEEFARKVIDRALEPLYDTCTWLHETPPVVRRVARMISSARILVLKRHRCGIASGEGARLPAVLARDARALLRKIASGEIPVIDTGGRVQARLAVGVGI